MADDPPPLSDLADAVLEGEAIDWASAESSADTPRRATVRQLKTLAGIVGLHREVSSEISEPTESTLELWGRLEILELIGRGSFGEVYRAWDTKLDREVALKLLRTDQAHLEGAAVLREARLLARVRHSNVAIVYDADEIDGRVGLWMEFIHGRNLEQILGGRKKFDDREVTRIGIEVCRALSAVHDAGLLHRDIKAQNLMQSDDGRLVLMDFGTGWDLEKTPASDVDAAGTPLYLAPEIFTGASATSRCDIYSTGVLLFHLLTGAYPVRGATFREIRSAHEGGERLNLSAAVAGSNAALIAVIARAIEPDPSKRFESARDMLAALENVRRRAEKPHRAALIAAGFALAIILVGGLAWLSRNDSPSTAGSVQALPFHARDWVLVAGFENRTGEKLFDGTLDYALGLELSNSRRINVVSRERVGDALRLMRRPPGSPLDAGLAREVCLRDGGIRALLTGRVEKLGSKYLLSAELVEPKAGTTLAGFREESDGTEGSLAAIRRISDRVRAAVGDTPPPADPDGPGLEKVTTNNLRALQLFSRADHLMRDRGDEPFGGGASVLYPATEDLLREAVAEDPAFASAWNHLAFSLSNQNKPRAEVLACAETAMRLAGTTTERERYFIQGSYYAFLGQREKAISTYETLLALHPDHYWAANNVAHLSDWLHNPQERENGIRAESLIAETRPRSFKWNWLLVFDYVAAIPDPARAAPYLSRAQGLITPEVAERFPIGVSYVSLTPFTQSWVEGDLAGAAREVDRVAATIGSFGGRARDCLAVHVALGYLTLGRVEAAEKTSEKILDRIIRNDMLAQIAFIKGDETALRQHLQLQGDRQSRRVSEGFWDTIVVLQAGAGLDPKPDPGLFESVISDGGQDALHTLRGKTAFARGHLADAIRELEEATKDAGDGPHVPNFYLARESLARALAKKGDVPGAIRLLEQNSERRDSVTRGTTAAFWLRNRLQLAELYRDVGRVGEARTVEAELSNLLAFADPDHPIQARLRELQKS